MMIAFKDVILKTVGIHKTSTNSTSTLRRAEEIVLCSVDTQDTSSVTSGRVSTGEEPGTHTT